MRNMIELLSEILELCRKTLYGEFPIDKFSIKKFSEELIKLDYSLENARVRGEIIRDLTEIFERKLKYWKDFLMLKEEDIKRLTLEELASSLIFSPVICLENISCIGLALSLKKQLSKFYPKLVIPREAKLYEKPLVIPYKEFDKTEVIMKKIARRQKIFKCSWEEAIDRLNTLLELISSGRVKLTQIRDLL